MRASREDVVREALRWEGTPYHPNGRLIGVGVDCAMFPAEVYEACGLVPHLEPDYNSQWHLHRNAEKYLEWVRPHAREIPEDQLGPGDFVIWKFGRTYSHGAIVIDVPQVIHAVLLGRAVIRDSMETCEDLRTRARLCFTLWES